jgi:hypothetical protein
MMYFMLKINYCLNNMNTVRSKIKCKQTETHNISYFNVHVHGSKSVQSVCTQSYLAAHQFFSTKNNNDENFYLCLTK